MDDTTINGAFDSFSIDINAGNHEGISFGQHFNGRNPDISEMVPNRRTPPQEDISVGVYDVDRSFGSHFEDRSPRISDVTPNSLFQKDSMNDAKLRSSNRYRLEPTSSQYLSIVNKWPENENTHMIGDIKNWPKYRPVVDRSINFTELIEENTIYEQSQTLRPYVLPSSPKDTQYLSIPDNQSIFIPDDTNAPNNEQSIFMPIDGTVASLPNDSDGPISFDCMSSTRVPKSKRKVDGSTQSEANKPPSSGNSLKAPTRAALGDVTSLMKNAQKPRNLPSLSSNKWVKNLAPNDLMPVREEHNKAVRIQSNGSHTSVSKIPILVDSRKTPVPNRPQLATDHAQPTSSRGAIQRKPNDDAIDFINKFPLGANKSALIWACTPLGSSVKKSFLIKNILKQPLRFKIEIIGRDFHVPANVMDLKAYERRVIEVTFCPSVIGKALGVLVFKPVMDWRYTAGKEKALYLCAYGGVSQCRIKYSPSVRRVSDVNVSLDIEELEDVTRKLVTCKGSLHIFNPAPVSGSVIIFAKPKTTASEIHETQIYIEPRKFICHPNEARAVTIACSLKFKEFERFRNQSSALITIAKIILIFGSEPDRQRIAAILSECDDPPTRKKNAFMINGFPAVNANEVAGYRDRVDHLDDLRANFAMAEIPLVISQTKVNETLNSTDYITCMNIEA